MIQYTGQHNEPKSKEQFQKIEKRVVQQFMQQIFYEVHKQIGIIFNCVVLVVLGTPPDWWNQTMGKYSQQTNETQTTKN